MKNKIHCPECESEIWDVAFANKLNKCWGCGLAFDSDELDADLAWCDGGGALPGDVEQFGRGK